jgi:hypothetical protein
MHRYAPLSQNDSDDDYDLDAAAASRNQRRSINQSSDHPPTDNQPFISSNNQSKQQVLYVKSKQSNQSTHDRPPIGILVMSFFLALIGLSLIVLSMPWPQSIDQSLLMLAKSELSLTMLLSQSIITLKIYSWWRALSVPIGVFLMISGGYTMNEYVHYRDQHRHPGGYLFPRYK